MFDAVNYIDFLVRVIYYSIGLRVDWPLLIVMLIVHSVRLTHRPKHFFHVHGAALMRSITFNMKIIKFIKILFNKNLLEVIHLRDLLSKKVKINIYFGNSSLMPFKIYLKKNFMFSMKTQRNVYIKTEIYTISTYQHSTHTRPKFRYFLYRYVLQSIITFETISKKNL